VAGGVVQAAEHLHEALSLNFKQKKKKKKEVNQKIFKF
jgi:hypothetical protein